VKIKFKKYHGTGNDFVLINNQNLSLNHSADLAIKLCDRHFGVGSDGLIIIEPSKTLDFNMVFYNPDGSKSFCGNGSRCAVKFSEDEGIINKNKTTFDSTDGVHHAEITNNHIQLSMHNPTVSEIAFTEKELPIDHKALVNTGSPHLILFINPKLNILEIDVRYFGAKIRYSNTFKKDGINVNFIGVDAEDNISIRTYERGVEDETLSCGTGVTAAAIAYHSLYKRKEGKHQVHVNAIGGQLNVKFEYKANNYNETFLCGPAELVYSGEIDI
jgi:diaminopimelate epimerase